MGLLSSLLGLPLAPLRGVGWVLEQVVQEAERQYADPAPIHRELAELEADLLAGRITEEEFGLREDELLDRLEQITAAGTEDWADPGPDEALASPQAHDDPASSRDQAAVPAHSDTFRSAPFGDLGGPRGPAPPDGPALQEGPP
ncbi:gas vesicle protein GvpG [Streptomyces sp. R08]|uniref:Gas vesicle protein GvpG n=1 Tax=Streptomyces sp. R08 TaxID=3238624 RepID=A0AB39M946_9ACTN